MEIFSYLMGNSIYIDVNDKQAGSIIHTSFPLRISQTPLTYEPNKQYKETICINNRNNYRNWHRVIPKENDCAWQSLRLLP